WLSAQGGGGVGGGGAEGGAEGGKQGQGEHEGGCGGEGDGVSSAGAGEERLQQAAGGKRQAEAGGDADRKQPCGFAQHHGENVATLGAERHAEAELAQARADGVGHDAVEAQAGEGEREGGEAAAEL